MNLNRLLFAVCVFVFIGFSCILVESQSRSGSSRLLTKSEEAQIVGGASSSWYYCDFSTPIQCPTCTPHGGCNLGAGEGAGACVVFNPGSDGCSVTIGSKFNCHWTLNFVQSCDNDGVADCGAKETPHPCLGVIVMVNGINVLTCPFDNSCVFGGTAQCNGCFL